MRVVARGDEQEEAHHDLVFLEFLAVHLGVHEHARQIVGGALAPFGDQLAAALEDLGDVFLDDALHPVGVDVRVARAERGVHQPRPRRVVLLGDPHEAPDHARDDGLRDVRDEVAASRCPSSRSSTSLTIALIASSWSAIRFGVKPAWNSALMRSCLGGSMPMNIARVSSSGNTTEAAVMPPRSEE